MVTMWKLVNGSADHSSPSYLTTGKQKLTSDPNIRLEEIRHHGSTLIIDQVVQQEKLFSSCQKVTIYRGNCNVASCLFFRCPQIALDTTFVKSVQARRRRYGMSCPFSPHPLQPSSKRKELTKLTPGESWLWFAQEPGTRSL